MGYLDIQLIEGKVILPGDGYDIQRDHTWISGPEGVIDPTKGQFDDWGEILGYIPQDIYSPHEFLSLCDEYPLPGDSFPDPKNHIDKWMKEIVN